MAERTTQNKIESYVNGCPAVEFHASALSARYESLPLWWGWTGRETRDYIEARLDRPRVYVVRSYETPIAILCGGRWFVITERFSVTTTKHQLKVQRAISGTAFPINLV